jgi:DNA polymerase-1
MKKGDHLFLVDGSGYIFRAYHALPPLTRKSDGLPVGAVSGFCNMLWKLMQDARNTDVGVVPTHFAVIFDYSSKTFRNEMYTEYKANRSAPPEDLVLQFGLIRQATRAFSLPCIEMEGFEADDLIATYARLACEAGGDTTIVSSDKDLMQLVGPTVGMYDPMKDKQIGIPEVIEKWGVPPEKMIDLQALVGDSVDNVPGVPGIGPKTAAQLLETYGDLDALLARAGEIKQEKRRQTIIDNADSARISRELVRLKNDVPIAVGEKLDDFVLQPPDGPRLISFLKAMEFTTLTRRVAEASGTDAAEVEAAEVKVETKDVHGPDVGAGPSPLPSPRKDGARENADGGGPLAPSLRGEGKGEGQTTPANLAAARREGATAEIFDVNSYICIRDLQTLADWVAEAREAGVVAFDTETNSLDPMQAELVGFSLATRPGRAAYVPISHKAGAGDLLGGGLVDDQIGVREAIALIKPLMEDKSVLKIGQNLKYDMLVMNRHGVEITPYRRHHADVLCAGRRRELHPRHGPLSERWLGHKPIAFKEVTGGKPRSPSRRPATRPRTPTYAAALARAEAAPRRARPGIGLRDGWSGRWSRCSPHGARGISVDRQIPVAPVRRFRADRRALRGRGLRAAGERVQPRLAQAARRHPVRQDGPARRHQDQDRRSGRPAPAARGPRRRRATTLPRKIARLAPAHQAEGTYTDALPGYVNPRPTACTPPTRWPRPRPAACPPTSRTCRTSRSAPRRAARSAPPSSPTPGTS